MFFVEWWNGGRERWDRLSGDRATGLDLGAAHRARRLFKLEYPANAFRLVDRDGHQWGRVL